SSVSTTVPPSHNKRRRFGPATRDIGHYQAVNIAAGFTVPAVSHQVQLHAAWERFVPVRTRADAYQPPRLWFGTTRLLCMRCVPRRAQQAVDGRGAHRENLGTNAFVEVQLPISLQGRQQDR